MDDLMKLKIPMYWAVLHNSFYDEDMIIRTDEPEDSVFSNGEIENCHAYMQDLLWMKQCSFDPDRGYILVDEGYALDLGWYPDSDPEGAFIVRIMNPDWDNIVFKHESRDRYFIAELIFQCLEHINIGDTEWTAVPEAAENAIKQAGKDRKKENEVL